MKRFIFLGALFCTIFLNSASTTFSPDRLTGFYDEFFCEEKADLADAGLTTPCIPVSPIGPNPPPNPSPPPFKTGLLPIIIVNNSTLPDDQVFILLTGENVAADHQVWGNIDTTPGANFGNVTLQNVALSDNSTTFSYALSQLPETSGGRVFYVPEIRSGLIWFSMSNKLSMTVVNVAPSIPALQIVQPNFTNPSDVNYTTNFDIFELAYLLAGSPQVAADATAVSFFSIPLYGYLAGATSVSSNTGLHQPRSFIMSHATAFLNTAIGAAKPQWQNLLLTSGGRILRLLSTGKAIGASLFDANYLDNSATYGYSYLSDIWTGGASSFYVKHDLNLNVTVTVPATANYNYTGRVQGDNTFLFTSNNGGPTVTFPAPVTSPTPTGTTTFNIFSAINFITPLPAAGSAGDAVSKLVQEAIIAGLVPTTDTLSLSYLSANQGNFYNINDNLNSAGKASGPWFDLYSKALHSLGSIYTFGFDEPLWPQVLLGAPFINNTTYLGITIGNVE